MTQRSLIVSLHDVTPSTFARVQRQVEELAAWGVHCSSLLVVPYYHGQERLDEDKNLIGWLQKSQREGHEIVLHGWEHLISRQKAEGGRQKRSYFKNWFYENVYTSNEAEFLDLNYEEAFQKIQDGLEMFRALDFNVQGFIAPAWLMNSEVERAAHDLGLRYTNSLSTLIDLQHGQRYSSRSCVWSTRACWRRICSRIWNGLLFQQLRSVAPLRISLHPCDIEHPKIWNQMKRLIQIALRDRTPTTYRDWIESVSR